MFKKIHKYSSGSPTLVLLAGPVKAKVAGLQLKSDSVGLG